MTRYIATGAKRRLWAPLMAGFAVAGLLLLGAGIGSARADDRHEREFYRHQERHGHWDGGYYRAPPVVYGRAYAAPGYYPPPVVYGPGIGLSLPGINVNIR